MEITCENCGFKDIPENWNAISKIDGNTQNIFIQCPACDKETFFQHFSLPMDCNKISFSHLFAATIEQAKTWQEGMKFAEKKRNELRLKYGQPLITSIFSHGKLEKANNGNSSQ